MFVEPLSEIFFKVVDDVDGLFELVLFDDDVFIFAIDDFDGLVDFALEVEIEGLDSVFDLGDFCQPEINEVAVVCPLDLLPVEPDLVVHQHDKMLLVFSHLFGSQQELNVCQNDEIVRPRIL